MEYLNLIIPFVGGLGMFIYGMQIMSSGLENAAGNKMKSILEVPLLLIPYILDIVQRILKQYLLNLYLVVLMVLQNY